MYEDSGQSSIYRTLLKGSKKALEMEKEEAAIANKLQNLLSFSKGDFIGPLPEESTSGLVGQTLLNLFAQGLDQDKNLKAFPTEKGQLQKVADEGDTLWSIARFFGFATNTGVAELIKHNPHIKNPDQIWPGDTINIPNRWQQKSHG